jgi:EAL domain-containing protein (putative c-di-GMP-specific phosphodiesterase class I)/PleD family two-component response regulator
MSGRPSRILMADDDEVALLLTSSALEAGGFEVSVVKDGTAAVAAFHETRPDCVILDVMMPGLDGFQACAAIRETGIDLPILIMTSHDDVASVARAYEVGATDFTSKGISARLLIERIRFLLREHQSRHALSASRRRLAMVQDMARIGHWEVDALGRTVHVSRLVRSLLGVARDTDIHLAHLVAALDTRDRQAVIESVQRWRTARLPFRLEARLATGAHLHLQGVTTQRGDASADATLTLAVQDISIVRQAQQQVHLLANFDALTGLSNRQHFLDGLARSISDRRAASPLAVMVFRLRGLDRLQKSLGQSASDAALVRSARLVADAVGADRAEFLAHLGAGAFALCDPACKSPNAAATLAADVARAFATPISGEGWTANLLVSTGIVVWPADGATAESLLENAITTAARGATTTESRHEFFAAEVQQGQRRLMVLESALCGALERGELSLHYQPRITLDDNHVSGLEALMRWTHPTLGPVSPMEFIPVAEETGLINQLGAWALHEACRQTALWRRNLGRGLFVSVNVSASQLQAPRALIDDVFAALRASGLPASALELELTESMVIEATPESLDALHELRRAGVTIALDDFGTGYSSLSYLRRLPIDSLKIDRSFISDLAVDAGAGAVLQAVLAVAGALRLRTVAEGIDSREQLAMLHSHGCHEGQGFLFSRPMPAIDVGPLLAAPVAIDGLAPAAA